MDGIETFEMALEIALHRCSRECNLKRGEKGMMSCEIVYNCLPLSQLATVQYAIVEIAGDMPPGDATF
jgi:hypothetical protein